MTTRSLIDLTPSCKDMTRVERYANLAGVVVPFAGVLVAIVLLWNSWVDAIDLAILAVMYFATAMGVTVGFHRLLTHRSFRVDPWLERSFAGLGQLSVQGSVLDWVADHRKHHAHTDVEGDPHSPHVGHGSGLSGLWHAHTGWLMETHGQADWKKYAKDLYEDPKMKAIGRRFPLYVLASLLIPTALGFVLHGFTWEGALRRLHLGWPGPDLPRAPRHVVGQLGLPLLRLAPLRRRGQVHQRGVAGDPVARRVLASQSPRLPAVGAPRPQAVGDRRLSAGDRHSGEGGAGPRRRRRSRPSARPRRRWRPSARRSRPSS